MVTLQRVILGNKCDAQSLAGWNRLSLTRYPACSLWVQKHLVNCLEGVFSSVPRRKAGFCLLLMISDQYRYRINVLRGLAYGAFRRATRGRCLGYSVMEPFFAGNHGLEIGGPTRIFCQGRALPVYDRCKKIDNCNFSGQTIWDDNASVEGFGFGPRLGKEYVNEANDLASIQSEIYDFVLACHVLEHLANPLRALQEWNRVLVPGGALLVLVPDKRRSFDRRRPITSLRHIQEDFQANVGESDLTHLEEIVALHDLNLDRGAGSPEQFRQRCLENARFRAMHHHIFDPQLLSSMFEYLGMQTLVACYEGPCHVVGFAKKPNKTMQSTFASNATN